ncbi:probable transcription factor At3g04930 [Juglans microcarpa x Juglans regia]|uniref:probable transcription factor At3g04930 n=1 Tax=Juglans microcarpa x Juglans regia TaxID=2249226 RepID=UPI001B7E9595|nr:probable transcription factor At3g04930 [Juglans microcarpa x Juglans regia]
MASEQDDTVFPEEDLDDELSDGEEDDDDEDDEDDDVINSASPSTSSPAANSVTVALPASSLPIGDPPIATSSIAATAATTTMVTPSPKRHPTDPQEKKPQPLDDSRRLFQRLWTDEDEIELLQGFLDYTTSRGSTHHNDTALFYDQIKSKLQLDFNKNQLVEKLRRLKKKYRNVLAKSSAGKDVSFKSPHDQATFEISRKIWRNDDHNTGRFAADDSVFDDEDPNVKTPTFNFNNYEEIGEKKMISTPRSRKRPRSQSQPQPGYRSEEKRISSQADIKVNGNDSINHSNLGGLIEETVRSCLSPLFKELLSNAMGAGGRGIGFGFGGLGMNAMATNVIPLSFGGGGGGGGGGVGGEGVVDERWRKQQILELEVYSKRLELVQDQIRAALDELRSVGR